MRGGYDRKAGKNKRMIAGAVALVLALIFVLGMILPFLVYR